MAHVLLLESDQEIAGIFKKHLTRNFSYLTLSICGDSQSAILAADEKRPDIVILELAVPGQNGLAFLQEFRSYADWMDIPIIIHSHIPPENSGLTKQEWEKHGVVSYLYKSTSRFADLTRAVKQYIDNETAQR